MIGMICIQENRKSISVTDIWFAFKCQWNLIFWSARISLFVSRIRFLIPHISGQSYTNDRFPLYFTYIRRSQNLHPKIEKTSQQVFTTLFFNPIDDVGRGDARVLKRPLTSFSPATSTNKGIIIQTFWSLILTLCKMSRAYQVPVPSYWTWIKYISQKNCFFWENPCKIEVMITSFIEILE